MEQMVKPAPLERVERVTTGPPLVFLDTQVILDYLRGKPAAVRLFDSEAANRLRLAINPIVAQELLLSADDAVRPALGKIVERMKMLPVDFAKVEKMVSEAARALQALPAESPRLKKRLAHSNDFIILSSADECDFLVTYDDQLKDLAVGLRPEVVTPKELIARLGTG